MEGYAGNPSIPHAFKKLKEDEGGYGSVDLLVTAAEGYKIYQVDYTVCYSSKGPEKTGWRADKDATTATSENVPTQFYYLDNITDGTTVDVYLMPAYTVRYQLMYGKNVVVDPSEYSKYIDNYDAGLFDSKVAYPKSKEEATANAKACAILEDVSKDGLAKDGNLYGYHRWCDHENELKAVNFAVSKFKEGYDVVSSVTVPTLTAKADYTVSGWKVGENNTVKFGDTVNMSDLAQYANENRVITLTAVVTDQIPNTDNSGNGGDSGNNGGDNNSGNNNNNGGDSGTSGGQESTPTPTPASTPSVTTVTAVAPTATPTATPAPTAEPTATPAPAAVSAHIPQTSDDMPYTLLVVTALASLCAAGAMFKKRRSK